MNSKERFITTLNLEEPDRVPIFDFLFCQDFLGLLYKLSSPWTLIFGNQSSLRRFKRHKIAYPNSGSLV